MTETLKKAASGMQCKAHGAQRPRHIAEIGEGASTAQRSNAPAQQLIRRFLRKRGFTLIELLVVLAIIATLLAIAAPRYFASLDRARESALRETLFVMRDAIDKYHGDTGRYPDSLQELADKRYLRKLPPDPITDSTETWITVTPPPGGAGGQVYDVKSGAPGEGSDSTPYADW